MKEFNITEFRKSKGLKQKDFATLIGVVQPYLSELESGKRPITKDVYSKIKAAYPDEDFSGYTLLVPKNESPITLKEGIQSFFDKREEGLISIIESQQRTIESLSRTIEALSNSLGVK